MSIKRCFFFTIFNTTEKQDLSRGIFDNNILVLQGIVLDLRGVPLAGFG